MKTHREIVAESEQLDRLGQQYWESYRRSASQEGETTLVPRVLFRFPATTITERVGGRRDLDPTTTHRMARCIEVDFGNGRLEYTLVEEDYSDDPGEGLELLGAVRLMRSDTVVDLLGEGYRIVEEDRLGELLAPFMARSEEHGMQDSIEAEIDRIVGAGDLTPAERLHARADIVAFLEGQLKPTEFISAAIERHGHRHTTIESVKESCGERLCVDQP